MRTSKFIGVFSKQAKNAAKGGKAKKQYYFAWELGKGIFALQEVDNAFMPLGAPTPVSGPQLEHLFHFEPGILAAPVTTPDFRHIVDTVQPAEVSHEATELTDESLRELEKARKAKQVENDLRHNFEKALRALSRPRDRKGALAALEQLADTREGIVPSHKHMFRDFGVSLRKKSLPDLALRCAQRAVQLAPNDDHAHFNVARLLGILGKNREAEKHLKKAIGLDGHEPVYHRLLAHLRGGGTDFRK